MGGALPGATVQLVDTPFGTISDEYGKFQLRNVPSGNYTMKVSFVGFQAHEKDIDLAANLEFQEIALSEAVIMGEEVFVYATRANSKTPTTYSTISKKQLAERNLGQDLPVLLNYSPSVVTTSDAGAGVGYTSLRIRGSDATRINVTINGIPLNDSESHGVFWVNMPDFASSVENIQIQRGIGTSSNGAAAFGATINLQTHAVLAEPLVELDNSAGSFNTLKNTVTINSGLIDEKFNFEGRLSRVVSDGYIDRSSSNLKSFFLSGGYYGDKTLIKAIVFGGNEMTQQAWYGTPEARINNDQQGLQQLIDWSGEYNSQQQIDNLMNSDRRFNYYLYDNEIDNYSQNHFQLLINQQLADRWNFTGALHYTKGKGYFEQYRENDNLADYGLADLLIGDSLITSTDLIRRRWLDNDFYGLTYSFNYQNNDLQVTVGGGYNVYDGDHFGEIIWARFAGNSEIRDQYYHGNGLKKDFNTYIKANYQLSPDLNIFGDMQLRTIDYSTAGIDSDLTAYDTGGDYQFFNPKVGISYSLDRNSSAYISYAIGHREPVRSDFIDALNGQLPKPEKLGNLEAGVRKSSADISYEANFYWMDYKDQLVLTGALNDVGASIRTNVPDSYRIGIELAGSWDITSKLHWNANIALSKNKIRDFTEILYDYAFSDDRYIVENDYSDTDISFSPNVVIGSDMGYALKDLKIQVLNKFVGRQYLDNTSNPDRIIDNYFVTDLLLTYSIVPWKLKQLSLSLMVNNVFDTQYQSNGYTWGYLFDGFHYQQNNYYPQAGVNFLAGLSLKF
ncbi:MAG: TonB-dependent receptor [Cyclobacteriaceae bacterium]|nr:MAG: TonB-dependent receptor [Cyclobacteriaceae bacterium]